MLKDLIRWLLAYVLKRMAPEEVRTPGVLELNSTQAARIIELEEEINGLNDDYESLRTDYVFHQQRIKDEGLYLENTEERLCMKLYKILQTEEKLPITADDIQKAIAVDIHEAEMMAATGFVDQGKKEKIKRIDYLYMIKADHRNRYKIGHSCDPEDRLATFRCGSPEHLKIVGKWSGGRTVEAMLHARLAVYGWQLEWFDLPDKIVQSLMAKLDSNAIDTIPMFESPVDSIQEGLILDPPLVNGSVPFEEEKERLIA